MHRSAALEHDLRRRVPGTAFAPCKGMQPDPLTLSLETVIAAAPMLGYRLEDRAAVRDRQDPVLVESFRQASAVPLANPEQQALFLVAPLDLLVVAAD